MLAQNSIKALLGGLLIRGAVSLHQNLRAARNQERHQCRCIPARPHAFRVAPSAAALRTPALPGAPAASLSGVRKSRPSAKMHFLLSNLCFEIRQRSHAAARAFLLFVLFPRCSLLGQLARAVFSCGAPIGSQSFGSRARCSVWRAAPPFRLFFNPGNVLSGFSPLGWASAEPYARASLSTSLNYLACGV